MSSSCKDMDRLIQLYVDREIGEEEHQRLKEHVQGCHSCRRNLQEMITLVQSLEEIRNHREKPSPTVTAFNHAIKWTAVYTAIAFLVAFVPGMMQHRNAQMNEMAGAPTLPSTNGPQQLMVLATQAEQVHIPESDYIRVIRPRKVSEGSRMDTALIYPSAMPLFKQGKPDWLKRVRRCVFVQVPDYETLQMILKNSGLSLDRKVNPSNFPVSLILTTGKKPTLKLFSFPRNEKKISHWFEEIAATPAAP